MTETPNGPERLIPLNAALDGETDALSAARTEREVAADPALQAASARLAAVRQAVRGAADERAPASLVAAIAAMAPKGETIPLPKRRTWSLPPMAMAASLVAAFAIGAGVTQLAHAPANGGVDDALAASYLRSQLAGGGIDIASSDRHTVKPWLATRAPLGSAAVDLADVGFKLVGGRVDIVAFQPVPTLVYAHGEHAIALTELPLDAAGADAPGLATVRGLGVASWRDSARAYRAVSDIDTPELVEFVKDFKAAVAKAAE
jgi:anti-sigma factor RsiW